MRMLYVLVEMHAVVRGGAGLFDCIRSRTNAVLRFFYSGLYIVYGTVVTALRPSRLAFGLVPFGTSSGKDGGEVAPARFLWSVVSSTACCCCSANVVWLYTRFYVYLCCDSPRQDPLPRRLPFRSFFPRSGSRRRWKGGHRRL